jgi:hypothetical protein
MPPQFTRAVRRAGAEVDWPTALKRQELSPGMSTLIVSSTHDFACVGVDVVDWLRSVTMKSSRCLTLRSAGVRASAVGSVGIC